MKFLATATLLLATAVSAQQVPGPKLQRKLDHYRRLGSGEKMVTDKDIYVTPEGDFVVSKRIETGKGHFFDLLIPRKSKNKKDAEAGERALQVDPANRRLATIVSGPKDGEYFSKGIPFEIGDVDESSKIVFEQGLDTDEMPLFGLANAAGKTKFHLKRFTEGTWMWKVVSDAGEVDGGTFEYGPDIVRNRGGVIERQKDLVHEFIEEAAYEGGGTVQNAVGRIYFNSYGVDYACTGTAIKDNKSGRSLILTGAHCIFDDIDWSFGTNAIFIPNRDAHNYENMTGDEIHRICTEDVCGCWDLSGGVVHDKWPDTNWPDRLLYDYGFYVVDDVGSHRGPSCGSDALDIAVDPLQFGVGQDQLGEHIYNFGYTLDYNPDFRYCAETTILNQPTDGIDTLWMSSCGLTGGASGGPWIAEFDSGTGTGKVVSVNSWSYSDGEGMGGPIIDESEARCLINNARDVNFDTMLDQELLDEEGIEGIGVFVNCYDRECVDDETAVRKLRGRRLCSETVSKP